MVVLVPGTRRAPGRGVSPTGISRVWRWLVVMGSYRGCWVATRAVGWTDAQPGVDPGVEPTREPGQKPAPGHGWDAAKRGGLPDRVLRRLRAQGERRGLAGGDDQTGGGSVGVEMGHVVLVQLRQGVPGQLVRVLRRTREEDLVAGVRRQGELGLAWQLGQVLVRQCE